jgi:hypothetical protein
MIRKALIVLLLIAAAATLTFGVTSYWHEWNWCDGAASAEFSARVELCATGGYGRADGYHFPLLPGVEQRLAEPMFDYMLSVRQGLLLASGFNYVPAGIPVSRFKRAGMAGWLRLYVSEHRMAKCTSVECHFSILLLVLLSYPAMALVRGPLRRFRRRRRGLCGKCGYNLTGNVTGVCSECGASIAAPVQAAS